MTEALKEAEKAFDENEVPVGAVIVYKDKIIARGYNKREGEQLIHGHAEFLAMMEAARVLGSWRLEDCDVYVTMEPCPMCAGAMIQSRIRTVYYGAKDDKSGVADSVMDMFELPFNHHVNVEGNIMADESKILLKTFFNQLRNK